MKRTNWQPARLVRLTIASALVAGMAVLAASAAIAGHARTTAKTPFNILYIASESGPLATVGSAFVHGGVTGARVLNGTGGVLGHPLTYTIVDAGSDPTRAVTILQQQLQSHKFQAVQTDFGIMTSVLAPILAKQDILLLGATPATGFNDPVKYPNAFYFGPTADTQGRGVAAVAKKKGYKSIGLIALDNASSHTTATAYQPAAEAAGLHWTSTVFIPPGTVDATPQLQQLLSGNPDVVCACSSTIAPLLLAARAKIGTNVPVICDLSCAGSANWASFNADQLKGVEVTTLPYLVLGDPSTRTPAFKSFIGQLNRLEPTHPVGINAPLVTYEAVIALRAGAKKANSIDPLKIAKALESLTTANKIAAWVGPNRIFSPTDHSINFPPSTFVTVPAAPQVNGFWNPKG